MKTEMFYGNARVGDLTIKITKNRLYIFPIGRNPENHVAATSAHELILNPNAEGHYIMMASWTSQATTSDIYLVSETNPLILTISSKYGVRVWHRTTYGKICRAGFCGAETMLMDIVRCHIGNDSHVLKEVIRNWVYHAGYDYDLDRYHDIRSAITALLYPLYRDIYSDRLDPDTVLNPMSLLFPHVYKSFKQAVKKLTGYDTPQMLKVLGKYLLGGQSFSPFYYFNHFGITIAVMFKDLLPVDITYEVISSGATLAYPMGIADVDMIREFLECLGSAERLRFARKIAEYCGITQKPGTVPVIAQNQSDIILNENGNIVLNADMPYVLRDTARMYLEYKDKMILPKKYKTITELHDVVANQYTQYQEEKMNQPIEYPDWVLELEKHTINGLRIRLARHTSELTQWGQKLGTVSPAIGGTSHRTKMHPSRLVSWRRFGLQRRAGV